MGLAPCPPGPPQAQLTEGEEAEKQPLLSRLQAGRGPQSLTWPLLSSSFPRRGVPPLLEAEVRGPRERPPASMDTMTKDGSSACGWSWVMLCSLQSCVYWDNMGPAPPQLHTALSNLQSKATQPGQQPGASSPQP